MQGVRLSKWHWTAVRPLATGLLLGLSPAIALQAVARLVMGPECNFHEGVGAVFFLGGFIAFPLSLYAVFAAFARATEPFRVYPRGQKLALLMVLGVTVGAHLIPWMDNGLFERVLRTFGLC